MALTLTPDEIYRITGKVQPAAQIRHLRRMGIKAEPSDNPDEPVCVMVAWLASSNDSGAKSKPRLKSDQKAA